MKITTTITAVLVMGTALTAGTILGISHNTSGPLDECPVTGDSKSPKIQVLNALKNRVEDPVNPQPLTLDQLVVPKGTPVPQSGVVTGYLVMSKLSGPESCECHQEEPTARDYHLYIGPKPDSRLRDCLICEVSGRKRVIGFKELADMTGKKVEVTGWIFQDDEHISASTTDNPKNKRDWRASIYEIHPVTKIKAIE